jgi:hypothetical protein
VRNKEGGEYKAAKAKVGDEWMLGLLAYREWVERKEGMRSGVMVRCVCGVVMII